MDSVIRCSAASLKGVCRTPSTYDVRVFKVKGFARFQRKERIADASLAMAIRGAVDGLIDADLGGGLIKQRVARVGQGK